MPQANPSVPPYCISQELWILEQRGLGIRRRQWAEGFENIGTEYSEAVMIAKIEKGRDTDGAKDIYGPEWL
jgi:hypothetical protein